MSHVSSGIKEPVRNKGASSGIKERRQLCSVCGDLRISEIVDLPNWTVAFYFPRRIFE